MQYSNIADYQKVYQHFKSIHYTFKPYSSIDIEGKQYNLCTFDMKNFQDHEVAKVVVLQDVTNIHNEIHQKVKHIVGFIIVLTILILVIIHFGFRGLIGKIEEKNAQLRQNRKFLQSKIKEQVAIITQEKALLRQQSKMAEMGNMIGVITHQWKQPLNVISTLIVDLQIKSMIQKPKPYDCEECFGLKDKLVNQYIDNINIEILYMTQTIEDFKNFLKPSKEKAAYSITTQIQTVERILSAVLKKNSITLNILKEARNDIIQGYPTEFAQVMLNLINNAKDAIVSNNPDKRTIDVTVSQDNQDILITVQDYAGGIAQKDMDNIFKHYYTTKGEQGTGIGLSIVQEIVTNMNGEIRAKNKNGGACFAIKMKFDN